MSSIAGIRGGRSVLSDHVCVFVEPLGERVPARSGPIMGGARTGGLSIYAVQKKQQQSGRVVVNSRARIK